VLHLLTKRREDLVAARTQTINRLHRLLVDLVPGGARRTSRPSGPLCCLPGSRRLSDAVYRCLVADQRLAVAAG
jgi:hypothetical protein